MPTTAPVRHEASVAPISERKARALRSARRSGAMAAMPLIWMPMLAKFAKPHSA